MVNLNRILAIFPEWGQKAPPHPRENIIAGNYILADTQAFLSKRHRQQNKKILIRHITGIGECFFLSNIQLTEKVKKFSSGAVKIPFSVSY